LRLSHCELWMLTTQLWCSAWSGIRLLPILISGCGISCIRKCLIKKYFRLAACQQHVINTLVCIYGCRISFWFNYLVACDGVLDWCQNRMLKVKQIHCICREFFHNFETFIWKYFISYVGFRDNIKYIVCLLNRYVLCEIVDFHCSWNEFFHLVGYYAANSHHVITQKTEEFRYQLFSCLSYKFIIACVFLEIGKEICWILNK
jgi:hypothetical protein